MPKNIVNKLYILCAGQNFEKLDRKQAKPEKSSIKHDFPDVEREAQIQIFFSRLFVCGKSHFLSPDS